MDIPDNWTFKADEVAAAFDEHVREQLPWYELATGVVAHAARHYIPNDGVVYDIGASTGNIGRAIDETLKARNATLYAIDNSEQMLELYKGPGIPICGNAIDHIAKPYDVAICFLVLMFLTPSEQIELLRILDEKRKPGGVTIVFDKRISEGGYAATILWRLGLVEKLKRGATPEQIINKELSLAGLQRPINPAILGNAVEVFRFGEFSGWLIS